MPSDIDTHVIYDKYLYDEVDFMNDCETNIYK